MNIFLIATLRRGKDILGYRLLDVDAGTFKDIPAINVYTVLKERKIKINGLKLRRTDNILMGNNGELSRYAKITEEGLDGKSPLVILEQLIHGEETIGYKVSDFKGKIAISKVKDVVAYAKENGIANGKVVTSNGKEFISSISGSYNKIQMKSVVSEEESKVQTEEVKKNTEEFKVKTTEKVETPEEKIWITIAEFREYMNKNGYSYKMLDENGKLTLSNIDNNIEILKIPVGVEYLSNLTEYSRGTYAIKKIYIPNTVKDVGYNFLNRMDNIEEIIYQDGTEHINLSYPTNMENLKHINIPKSVKKLTNFPILDDNIDLSDTSIEQIDNSFNFSGSSNYNKVINNIVLPNSIRNIKDSFNNLEVNGVVKFGSNLDNIINSFSGSDIAELDFTNATQLDRLGYGCFKHNSLVKKIDLSNTQITEIGNNTFAYCKEVQEIIFPETLTNLDRCVAEGCDELDNVVLPPKLKWIGDECFRNFKQTKIEIPNSIEGMGERCFSADTDLIFAEGRETVHHRLLNGMLCKEVILPNSLETINASTFRGCTVTAVHCGASLTRIATGAFENTDNLEEIDLRDCINLKSIGDKAFIYSKVTKVVFPEGLTSLGSAVFKGCSKLHSVLLPSTITDFGRGALTGSGSDILLGTTFYVYSGTIAHNYCKRNKLKHIIINSLDDFDSYFNKEERVLDERKLAKFRMMISLSEDKNETKLLEDEYINYADILLKLNDALKSEQISHYNVELDTSKYIDVPVEKIPHMQETSSIIMEKHSLSYNTDLVFNTLSNLITTTHDLIPECLTTKAIEYYTESNAQFLLTPVYSDKRRCIYYIGLTGNNMNVGNGIDKNYRILVIAIDGKIKFVSMNTSTINRDKMQGNLIKIGKYAILKPNDTLTEPIVDYLQTESVIHRYGSKSIINTAPVPRGLGVKIYEKVLSQWIMLDNKIVKANMFDRYEGLAEQRFMCAISGKIIETEIGYTWSEPDVIKNDSIQFIKVNEIKPGIQSLDENSIASIKDSLVDMQDTRDLLYKINSGDDYLNKLKMQPGAYDEPKSYEFELGNVLAKLNIKSLSDINEPAFTAIVNTAFFTKIKRSVSDIMESKSSDIIECEDGIHLLVQFRAQRVRKNLNVIRGKYLHFGIALLRKGQYGKNEKVDCYVSGERFSLIVSKLISIGNKENTVQEDWRLNNQRVNPNNYVKITNGNSSYFYGGSADSELAINKLYGNVALIGHYNNKDIPDGNYTMVLLNFKDLESGALFMNNIDSNEEYESTCDRLLETINVYEEHGKLLNKYYDIDTIREYILQGYPNGYHTNGKLQSLYDMCLKQKPNQ